jgi:hypothetical protein
MQTLISVRDFGAPDGDAVEQHRSVSRIALRQVLLAGLGECVQFGRTFVRYETHGDRVVAYFEDARGAQAGKPRPDAEAAVLPCDGGGIAAAD